MEFKDLKLPEFAAWLRALPPDTVFMDGSACTTCPVGKYCGHSVAAWIFGLPRWASEFIEFFDDLKPHTLNSALLALGKVEAKYAVEIID